MPTSSLNFTKIAIERITPPKQKKSSKGSIFDTYKDTKTDGLVLLVTNSGNKTFYLYKKIKGKPERVKIGKFDTECTVEKARRKARSLMGEIADGHNPQQTKRNLSNEMTFKELADKYIEEHAKLHTRSWKHDLSDVERNLKHWFNRKISSITPEEIRKLHADMGKKKKVEGSERLYGGEKGANRLLDRINAIFNKAVNEWGWDAKNPAKGVKKFKVKSRDRFVQSDEMPKLFTAINESPNKDIRDYIYLSLATGARRGNIVSMKWEQLSFERKEWRIPETKNGDSLIVPLHKDAVEILKERKKSNSSDFVFPSDSQSGHVVDFKKGWKTILTNAGIKDLRIHDLRRTLGSYQTILGANAYIIGKSLGHKSRAATDVYARLNLDPVRESMDSAFDRMKVLGKKKEKVKKK